VGKMTQMLEIRLIQSDIEYKDVLEVRNAVFIKEQNIPQTIEYDGLDKESFHVLVKLDEISIGCARIRSIDGKIKLERIAILKDFRNKGYGKRLMQYLVSYCEGKKSTEIIIHAQYYLREFYEKLGFKPRGEIFLEAGIKHIEMYRK